MEDYSKDYLDGKFGAIPIIKHIIDWDKVWKELETDYATTMIRILGGNTLQGNPAHL